MGDDKLRTYRQRRNLRRSPEPAARRRPGRPGRRFVIHQHDATSRHYDFRLEADGVLKSWAVPKGPSTDPRQRRMARRTEDHPVDYADFEGVIPPGEYGAGPVIVWDAGSYCNLTRRDGAEVPVGEALEAGHVVFWLDGQKLTGGYALTRIAGGEQERWLLVKAADEAADARRNPVRTQPESVRSGRRIEDVAAERSGA